jgi:hypothetical protein
MNKQIVKRMEELLHAPNIPKCEENPPPRERPKTVITCTKQRRLRDMQSELITNGSLTNTDGPSQAPTLDNNVVTPIKDLIDARIAQTEGPEEQKQPGNTDDRNRTLINLDALAASIYFWSPNPNLGAETRKPRFIQDKFRGQTCASNNDAENNAVHRNKETFINFSQPALIMVGENPETPPNTLKWLAAHHSAEVRKAVAQNENTDEETLRLLAEDFDTSVQSAVLDNTSISKELTVKLAASRNFSIASKARNVYYRLLEVQSNQSPKPPTEMAKDKSSEIEKNEREFLKAIADSADPSRRVIAKSPRLSADWHIRMLVAGDPNATAEILWQLASHPVSQVKRKLVDKYNCLLETLVNLKGYKKPGVKDTIAASATETIN